MARRHRYATDSNQEIADGLSDAQKYRLVRATHGGLVKDGPVASSLAELGLIKWEADFGFYSQTELGRKVDHVVMMYYIDEHHGLGPLYKKFHGTDVR